VAIDADGHHATGEVKGLAFKAAAVTFFRRKTGHVLLPGRLYCGEVRAVDIGIHNKVMGEIAPRTFANDPDFWLRYFPRLKIDGHKYDPRHADRVRPMEFTAARLAARAALGLVQVWYGGHVESGVLYQRLAAHVHHGGAL
jgi:hypothetical protein